MSEERINKDDDFVLTCIRCKHKWPRKILTRLPKVCPECKSPYWNRPRIKRENKTEEKVTVENHA